MRLKAALATAASASCVWAQLSCHSARPPRPAHPLCPHKPTVSQGTILSPLTVLASPYPAVLPAVHLPIDGSEKSTFYKQQMMRPAAAELVALWSIMEQP